MNYSPQQLARALQLYSSMGGQGDAPAPRTPLSPMQMQGPASSGGSMLDPAGLMKMFGGLMGGMGGGTPPNPYAMGSGAYMDAGSMPMYGMA